MPLRQNFPSSVLLTFWARSFFVIGVVLCFAECLAASLASIHSMPVVSLSPTVKTKNVSIYVPRVGARGKITHIPTFSHCIRIYEPITESSSYQDPYFSSRLLIYSWLSHLLLITNLPWREQSQVLQITLEKCTWSLGLPIRAGPPVPPEMASSLSSGWHPLHSLPQPHSPVGRATGQV